MPGNICKFTLQMMPRNACSGDRRSPCAHARTPVQPREASFIAWNQVLCPHAGSFSDGVSVYSPFDCTLPPRLFQSWCECLLCKSPRLPGVWTDLSSSPFSAAETLPWLSPLHRTHCRLCGKQFPDLYSSQAGPRKGKSCPRSYLTVCGP